MLKHGYIHVYTGCGKGKTTSALGLVLRAIGAGHRVFFAQFIKKRFCSEHKALRLLGEHVVIKQYGCGFVNKEDFLKQSQIIRKGFVQASKALLSGQYDVFVMDEINIAVHYGFIEVDELLNLMQQKPKHTELILTGRYAHERVIASADLVTEMLDVKHYFAQGVEARKGIEY